MSQQVCCDSDPSIALLIVMNDLDHHDVLRFAAMQGGRKDVTLLSADYTCNCLVFTHGIPFRSWLSG